MAMFRCKMCGGELSVEEGNSVCTCEYCGTKQTVPKADDERKMTLFNRAGRLLRNCEFDKASGVFETLVADFPEEAEAYWGLVLCKYGIEYVDDPGTGRKVPTCHRSSFDNVLDDPNFEQACEYGDATARRVYRDEAREIEEIRKGIIEVSGKEEPYDVFISYKETDDGGERTLDSVIAQDIYNALTEKGYRTFFSRITLENKLGTEYEPYIFAALNSAKVMLVVGTDYENFDSVWVKNEWSRFLKLIASGQKKTLIPVFKNMDAYDMPKEFARLAAQDMGKVGAMQDLIRGVEKLIPKKKGTVAPTFESSGVQGESGVKAAAAVKRGNLALEARDWEKAKQYFDQALTLDAESAEAYFGIALAELRASGPDDYTHNAASMTPNTEMLRLAPNMQHVQCAAEEYAVPGFLTEDTVRELYQRELSYPSTVKGQQALKEQLRQTVEGNRNLSLALRFAKGSKKEEIEAFKEKLYAKLEENIQRAKAQEAEARASLERDYAEFLKDADRQAQEKSEKAKQQRQSAYEVACSTQRQAKTVGEYRKAIEFFGKTAGYLDTDANIARCEAAVKELHAKEAAKNKKTAITITSVAAAALALVLLVTQVILPAQQNHRAYEEAMAMYEQGDYDGAIAAFTALADYKDSKEKTTEVDKAKNEAAYQVAMALYDQKDYSSAYEKLLPLKGYKDVEELLKTDKNLIAARVEPYKTVGSTVTFGSYEQDNNTANGKEAIEWVVLANEGDQSLLISRYALDCKPYNTEYKSVTWETCTLRSWLNSDFLKAAFSQEEQSAILTTEVDNSKGQGNSSWNTDGGNDTRDKVFLLSYVEAGKYFGSDNERVCTPTAYAVAQNAYKNDSGNCCWWLRSPGYYQFCAAYVSTDGSLGNYFDYVFFDSYAVRPAFWINLESDIF